MQPGASSPRLLGLEVRYRPSLITAPLMAVHSLVRLKPGEAVGTLFTGIESGYHGIADLVSAVDNTVVNTALQAAVGGIGSPQAADTAGERESGAR